MLKTLVCSLIRLIPNVITCPKLHELQKVELDPS